MSYENLLSQMIEGNRETRANMFSSKPDILRYTGETNAMCPFTQWYCNPQCALASILDRDGWQCSLGKDNKICHKID